MSPSQFLVRFGTSIVFVLLVLVLTIHQPDTFPQWSTARDVLNEASILLILSLGLTVVMVAGEFDLSIAGVASASGVAGAALSANAGASVPICVLGAIAVGIFFGLANGVLVTVIRIPAFIATLATGSIALGAGYLFAGDQPIYEGIARGYANLGTENFLGLSIPFWVGLVLVLVLAVGMRFSRPGRLLDAVGQNSVAATLSGVSPSRFKLAAFTISGTLAGLAGMLLSARLSVGDPQMAAGLLLPAFGAVFIGAASFYPGRFNISGTVLGVLLWELVVFGVVSLNLSAEYQNFFQGGILLLAVGFSVGIRQRKASYA